MSQSTQRAYQEVLDWLEKELRKGSIAIGDKLPGERALAEQFELSRASVREAIRILTSMGLVRTGTGSGPHSGAIVISEPSAGLSWAIRMHLSARSLPLKDLVNTCILIESNAAADAATPEISPDSPRTQPRPQRSPPPPRQYGRPHLAVPRLPHQRRQLSHSDHITSRQPRHRNHHGIPAILRHRIRHRTPRYAHRLGRSIRKTTTRTPQYPASHRRTQPG